MASLESYAQQASSVLLGGLNYNLAPGASYVEDRRSVYWLTSSAGTFTQQGVRHIKVSCTGPEGQFADLHTARLTFRIRNAALDNGQPDGQAIGGDARVAVYRLRPLAGPHCFIRRLTVYCGATMVEDLVAYNRVHEMFETLTPKDWKAQNGIFDYKSAHGTTPAAPLQTAVIANGDTITVSLQICSGLFQCGKYWPLAKAPIHIHLELEEPEKCLVLGAWGGGDEVQDRLYGEGALVDVRQRYTQFYEIQDVRVLCDVITLTTGLNEQYNKLLADGGALTVHGTQYITHSQAIAGENPLVSVTRGCARLKQIFWSFERTNQPQGVTTVNDFYHPRAGMGKSLAINTVSDNRNYECWWQIGSKRYPQDPLRTTHEYYRSLLLCLGLSYDREEPLDLTQTEYLNNRHIGGICTERALGLGFSGINTKSSGDLLVCQLSRLNIPGTYGVAAADPAVRMLHIVLAAELIIEIRQSGVSIAD